MVRAGSNGAVVFLALLWLVAGLPQGARGDDRYAVPNGDVPRLLKFIEELRQYRPENLIDSLQHPKKAPPAIRAAAMRVLELEQDPQSPSARLASGYLLQLDGRGIAEAKTEEQAALAKRLAAHLTAGAASSGDIELARRLGRLLEKNADWQAAGSLYGAAAQSLAAADDPASRAAGKTLAGAKRRVGLLGKKLPLLTGATRAGQPVRWEDYQGKVVLIDFWATWCEPCLAELPHQRAAYKQYHEQGLEILGINLDENPRALDAMLAAQPLPWPILRDDGGPQSMATYYGILALPTAMLVDRQGRVVSLRPFGRELDAELKRLFAGVETP